MKFIVSEKSTQNGIILVVTDPEIVGKKQVEGKKQLDLANKFYQGEETPSEEVEKLISNAYILHLTGIKAVAFGLKLGLVDKGKIISVNGIPHAEVLME